MKSQSNSDFELTRRQRKEGYTTEKENLEESPLKKAIIAAMIGVGGIGAYKSGMLKKPISKLIEFAGDYQSLSPAVGTAFKSWAGEETKFQNSVLRKKFRHTISDAFTENKPIEKYVSSVLEDTEKDLKYLKKTTKKYVEKRMKKNMKGELSSLATTELSYNIGKMNEIAERFDNRSARKAKDIMTKDFLKNFTVSAEESAKKMKRTGYRTATIDDMFEVGRADNGKLYLMNKHDNFMFDIKTRKNLAIFLNETKAVDSNGKYILNKKNIPKSIFETGDYKNIMVDKNLVINEFGEVADMRQNIKDINSFLRDAANEFKIPFVGINPLKFFGVGRAGVREQMFETLHPNTVQPSVTGLTGRQKLKDLKEFGNKRLLFSNGTAYKFNSDLQDFEKVADGLTLREYNHRNNIDSKLNDFRKMSGIELRKYEEYTKEDGAFKYYKGKLSKFLDLGRQDSKSNKYEESLINSISPNNIIEKASDKLFSKLNFTKPNVDDIEIYSAFGEIGDDWERNEKLYVALKKHIRWKDVMDPLNNTTIKEYFAQFFKGRKDVSNITESTLATYHLFERMNQAFKPFGIALGSDSMGSTKDIISGLLLKRLLPVYMVGQGIEYMTYLSERDDGDGGTTNIKKGVANVVKDINLGVTKVKDATGITSLFKGLKDSMPGYESFSELPLIKNLGLDRTYEEQKEWYNSGMEAIRKGRYWDLGNCVVPWQEIQTGYGEITLANNININDNVITHEGILRKVLEVVTRYMKTNEKALTIETHTTFLTNTTTDNHPYYAVKKKRCPSSSNDDCRPDRKSKECDKCRYKACNLRYEWNPEWIYARDLEKGDYLAYPRIKIKNEYKYINGKLADYDLGYLLGIYLAEGNIHTWHKNGNVYGIELALNSSEIEIANNIKNILDKYFPNTNTNIYDYKDGTKRIRVRNLSNEVAEWFRNTLYNDNKEKTFVKDIYKYNESFIKAVITGLIDGDGHYQFAKNSFSLHYTSSRIEYVIMLRNILFTFGIPNSLVKHDYKDKDGSVKYEGYRICVTGDAAIELNNILKLYKTKNNNYNKRNIVSKYTVVDDNYVYIRIKDIYDSGYNGIVYDYRIEQSHSFCSLSSIMHNTAFIGGKISHFEPNWYRRTIGDADFSENKYGSRKEYFENTWYPNPVNPFAPIKHFITDKYHYEEKHYYDRPYLLTSPEFENVPLVGPVLSSTVGRVIKPQVKMHEEYWNSPKGTNSLKQDSYIMDYNTDERGNENVLNDSELITNNNIENVSTGNSNILNIKPKGSTLGVVGQNLSDDGKEIYVTNSGNIGFIDINRDNYTKIKRELKTKSPKSMLSINNAPNREPIYNLLGRNEDGELVNQNGDVIINPNELKNSLKDQYMDSTNVLGLYGFLANSFVTGNLGEDQDVIDTPSYAFSYNKEFWDANMGGLGGDISEIFRRFVQKRRTDVDYYNPIRNTQPDWMPGSNYFQDYKHGDPFSKISNGELRLAGTPYEKIWGIKDPLELRIGSSFLGKTKDEIVDHFLQNDTITDEGLVDIVETGTKMHEEIEQEWLKDGFALEVEGRIEDEENKILGFYDAKVVDPTAKTGVGIVDIKTISDKGFNQIVETGEAKDLHRRQVNYYLWATGNDKGYVHYVNRDDPNKRYTVGFDYDEDMLEDSLNNVKDARNEVLQRYYNNEISRGDLYKPIDRYRILADVAPWSQEFTEMQNVLRASGMDETTKREYDEINERVKVQKKAHNTYEYRYRYADVSSVNAKITKVKGNQFYTDYGGEERAIKFAGINLGVVGNAEEKKRIESISSNIKEGASVQLLVDEDSIRRDKSKSIKAVVIDSKGTNLNKEFLKQGVAEEDKDDWSAPSVHARYSKTQIAFGSIWERFAHMDTPFHTKFLQVRSATEDYKRREVYGVDFARWQEPIEDFLKPAVYSAIERPTGLLFGALLGSLFGKKKFGKYAGAIAGMGAVLVGKGVVRAKEAITGEKWIPEPVRKERELVEYMDVLKYVKNQNLYNHYKKRALDEEGFDVDEYEKNIQEEADKREHITNSLKKGKKFIKEDYEEANEKKKNYEENKKPTKHEKTGNEFLDKILNTKYEISKFLYDFRLNRLTEKAREKREDFREVNKKINGVESYRNIDMLPELATKALEYKEKAEKTMYGYDVGEPLTNILAALPKIDRDRINDFINAPEEEREELLEIAPDYVKRVLQSSWGLEVDEKPSLEEYFKRHQLPDESWEGWQEDVDLESIKVKMINKEGLDYSDFNVWDDDVERADMLEDIPLPTVNFRNNAINIKNRLNTLLNDIGIQDVKIDYTFSSSNANVDLNIQHSSRDQVEEKINNQKFL